MDSTVKVRPNHYELLGLSPTAKLDELDKAFARELRLPRAFGSLAEFTVAYETLRDPVRREAYDASLGLKPQLPSAPPEAPAEWAPFLVRASARPMMKPRADPAPASEPRPSARLPERVSDPRPSPFLAASRPEAAEPEVPQPKPEPEELTQHHDIGKPEPETTIGGGRLHFAEAGRFHGEPHPFRWKLPAMAAGALILAVGVGAWTGWEAGNDNESVTVKVPPPKPRPMVAGPAAVPEPAAEEEQPRQPEREVATRPSRPPARPPLQIDLPDEPEPAQVAQVQPQEPAAEPDLAQPRAAPAVAAKIPLPSSVVARTIDRIGSYSCGQVASTTALESPGVFKVTCTSGQSFRAAPVHGRYRFRRLGSR